MRQTILGLALLCVVAVPQSLLAAHRLNRWTAINVGLAALKAKYPEQYRDLLLTYRPFVAEFEKGVWYISGKNPFSGINGVKGGGAPTIEVRDRDEKILKIYFPR